MKIKEFKLERYFAKYEFSAPYLLSSSDCEAFSLKELLDISDPDSVRMWENLKLGYTDSLGHPVLREEISKLYKFIHPDQVIVVTPEEGIFIAMHSLLEKGDHIITTFPGYQSLYEVAGSLGCEADTWTPKKENEWIFDINDLRKLIKENTRLIVINFPHNPTGATIKQEELAEIIEIARQKNIAIFSDEMYRFLEYKESNRLSSACDLYDNAVSLFGMSKSFALAGLRIGWLTTKNPDLMKKFIVFKDYTTICSSAPSEILAIMALRAKQYILKRNLELISSNLTKLDVFFKKYNTLFEWYIPQAGPIGFPGLNPEIDVTEFCHDLVERQGVMLLPSSVYNFKSNHFRIGFARKNMPQALSKLEEYLNENIKMLNKNL